MSCVFLPCHAMFWANTCVISSSSSVPSWSCATLEVKFQGKAVVCNHESSSYDAQQVSHDIQNYMLDSMKAKSIKALNLPITLANFGDGHWKESAAVVGFILNWQDIVKVCKYIALSHCFKYLHEKANTSENIFIYEIKKELYAMKQRADPILTISGTQLSYCQYCCLIMSAAAWYNTVNSSCNATISQTPAIVLNQQQGSMLRPSNHTFLVQ